MAHASVGIGEQRTFAGLGGCSMGHVASVRVGFFGLENMSTDGSHDMVGMLEYVIDMCVFIQLLELGLKSAVFIDVMVRDHDFLTN